MDRAADQPRRRDHELDQHPPLPAPDHSERWHHTALGTNVIGILVDLTDTDPPDPLR